MWIVNDIELFSIELDFSSSGQQKRVVTSVRCDGVQLVNALELIEVESNTAQVRVCEQCGVAGCKRGNWVSFRSVGTSVIWLPAWEELAKPGLGCEEYAPPHFLRTKGTPVFSVTAWERLRARCGALPVCETIPRLSSRDVARAAQWSAPARLLGEFPGEPTLRRDVVIAATDSEGSVELDAIDAELRARFHELDPMEVAPTTVVVDPIVLWLDLLEASSWKGIGRADGQFCFLADETTAFVTIPSG